MGEDTFNQEDCRFGQSFRVRATRVVPETANTWTRPFFFSPSPHKEGSLSKCLGFFFLWHFCTQLLSNLFLLPVSRWENAYWLLEEEPILKSSEFWASSPSGGASSWLWVSSGFGASIVTMSESSLIVPIQDPSSGIFSFSP